MLQSTPESTPESGSRAGYSGHKRRKGSKVHAAVDTLGYPVALTVTPASEDERTQVQALTAQVQAVTGEHVEIAYVDQGYTGPDPAASAQTQGIELVVIKTPEAKRGFVTRLRLAAQAMGGGAQFRLDEPLSEAGARLRTPATTAHWIALPRLRLPHAPSTHPFAL